MKHEWEHPAVPIERFGCRGYRVCKRCKAEQVKDYKYDWNRIVGHYWHPLVGRCKTPESMSMRPTIPTDLPSDPADAYIRGWNDRASKAARKAGKVSSPAKTEAARLNAQKPRGPRKRQK